MDHLKRESDSKYEDSVLKKAKVRNLSEGNQESKEKNLDSIVSGSDKLEPTENNGNSECNLMQEVSEEANEIVKLNSSSENNSLCNLKKSTDFFLNSLPTIEADAAEDKGSRHSMEDAWVVLLDGSMEFPGNLRCLHFAIYDGHGGRLAAEYARSNLHMNVLSAGLPRELMDIKAAKKAIIEGFRKTDESLLQESAAGGWQDGATAVCVWVLGQTVLVANIGDAKAVVACSSPTDGSNNLPNEARCPLKAIVLTREHKAIYPQERARIQKAGGSVGSNGRLQGRLEISRAFGDRQFKKVGVIATPDVHSFNLTEREKFIILGCDGLWGVFGPSDAVEFIQKHLQEGLSATAVARRLVREAVRERRCKDNCTAIVVIFRHS